jgi:hypothetical protein
MFTQFSRARFVGFLTVAALGVVLATGVLQAQSGAHYRNFQFGASLASVATLTGVRASQATVVHQRPVLLQDLEWRLPYTFIDAPADPVEQIVFSFCDDHLFRLVVDYSRRRTEGLTNADVIEAVSTMYGQPSQGSSSAGGGLSPAADQSGIAIAEWHAADYSAILYRSSFGSGLRLVVTSPALALVAHNAELDAVKLEAREAPQLERARQQREADAAQAALEKARTTNKPAFQP